MKRILFITPLLWNGGAERVVSVLSNSLHRRGIEVGIFVYKPSEYDYYVSPGIERFTFSANRNSKLSFIERIRGLRKVIKEYKPDVCIPFLDSAVIDTWAASFLLRVPYIATCRNKPVKGSSTHELLRNFAFFQSDAVFLQTDEQKQFFNDLIIRKSFVINNPVDERYLKAGENRTSKVGLGKIVTCGRLHKQKNHEMLIRAVVKVHDKHPETSLEIYGKGPEESSLGLLIQELKADKYISLKGYVSDTLEVLDQASMFVLSSNYEGFPNALIEAMAMGIPVCSTDCPTGPKALLGANSERGELVPVGDSEALAESIICIIDKADVAEKKAMQARQYVQDCFSPDIISGKLLESINYFIKV